VRCGGRTSWPSAESQPATTTKATTPKNDVSMPRRSKAWVQRQNARAHRAPENLGRPKKESDSDNDSENSLSDTELKGVVEKGGEELKGPRGGTSRWTKLRVEKRQNLPVARPPPGQPEAQPVRVSAYGPPTLESALESAKAWLGDWPYIPNYEKKAVVARR
jgi:hypothetical protein